MGNNNPVILGKLSNLADRHSQIFKLLFDSAFLTLLYQGVASKGDQKNWFGFVGHNFTMLSFQF
jgi:hypothetical protein